MATIITRGITNVPGKPEGWPTEEDEAFMMKHYGSVMTWEEWDQARSDRMVPDASELKFDADGILTF